jgi:hypothetical protein
MAAELGGKLKALTVPKISESGLYRDGSGL